MAVPVKGLWTFTENTELKGSEHHLEEKQASESAQKGFKIFSLFCLSVADN